MDFLLNITIRPLLLAAVAAAALWMLRVKSAQVRHAVWTLVTAGMLLQIAFVPSLPAVKLRVLRPLPVAKSTVSIDESAVAVAYTPAPPPRRPSVDQIAGCIYVVGVLWCAAQLLYAGWFTRRLVRESVPVGGRRYESRRITVPVTVGRKILLPPGWREWDAGKLAAVLAHEEAHVTRRDWAVAAMARVNRCVFWFHPLAWWLERVLARFAEQVCDDAALAVVTDHEMYASVLMDMARAAGSRGGRVSGAIAMAKEANVELRINRILDASRRVPKELGRAGWLALSVGDVLLIYMAAVVQLAPAQSPIQSTTTVQDQDALSEKAKPASPGMARPPQLLAQAVPQRSPAPRPQEVPGNGVGTLSGAVLDPSGARIPSAVVTVLGQYGNRYTASTNALGEWSLSGLPAGSYSLDVLVPGFASHHRSAIEVAAGADQRIDTNLVVGSTLESVTIVGAGIPRPTPAVTQGATRVRVGGNVQAPRKTRNVVPVYPPLAQGQGITGTVVLQAVIGKSGKVLEAQVMNNAPPELGDAALAAVQGWEYSPAMLNGEPVDTLTTITINFQLNQQ